MRRIEVLFSVLKNFSIFSEIACGLARKPQAIVRFLEKGAVGQPNLIFVIRRSLGG